MGKVAIDVSKWVEKAKGRADTVATPELAERDLRNLYPKAATSGRDLA